MDDTKVLSVSDPNVAGEKGGNTAQHVAVMMGFHSKNAGAHGVLLPPDPY